MQRIKALHYSLEDLLSKHIVKVLFSKNTCGEVLAAVQLLVPMAPLYLESFDSVFKLTMKLVFHTDETIRNEVIKTFSSINIHDLTAERAVNKFAKIYVKSDLNEKTCVEEILKILFSNGAKLAKADEENGQDVTVAG